MAASRVMLGLGLLMSYLISINVVTIACYGYDKLVAGRGWQRVPEQVLHGLSLLGGSPGASLAMQWFRHKSSKGPFRAVYWGIVLLQIVGCGVYLWWREQRP